MNPLCLYLAEHGAVLLAGSTCLLVLGCAGMLLQRSPIYRQRAGELAVVGVLVWATVALVPLPRVSWTVFRPGRLVGPETPADAEVARGAGSIPETYAASVPAVAASADRVPESADSVPAIADSAVSPDRWLAGAMPAEDGAAALPDSEGPSRFPAISALGLAIGLVAEELPAWLARAYLAGLVICAGWLVLGRVFLMRVLRSAGSPEPWLEMVYDDVASPGRPRPRLLVCERSTRAFSFGLWRPTIVLPQSICRAEQAAVLGHVLRHELAHVRQGDGWGHMGFNLAFPLLYFHPLYWWLRVRTQLAAEIVADDRAAAPEVKDSYVQALVGLARGRSRPGILCFSSHGMSSSPSQFCRRMQMLLVRKNRLAYRCSWRWRLLYAAACIVAVAAIAGTMGVPPAQAQVLDAAQAEAGALKKEIASLQDKNAGLQKQLAELKARMKAAEAKGPSAPAPRESQTMAIQVTRDAQGGRAARILELVSHLGPSTTIEADKKGDVVIIRGKPEDVEKVRQLIEEIQSLARPPVPGEIRAVGRLPLPGERSARPAGADQPALDTSQLDLVSLANSCSDALEKLEIARSESRSTLEAAKQKVVSQHDADLAAIKLKAAERRVALLQSIAEHAVRAAKLDMELLQFRLKEAESRAQAGLAGTAEVLELKTRLLRAELQLSMLERILAQQ